MYKLSLNDASVFAIESAIEQVSVQYKGADVKGIKFVLSDESLSTSVIKEKFSDEVATATIKVLFEDNSLAATYNNFSILKTIGLDSESGKFFVIMVETTTLPKLIESLQNAVNTINSQMTSDKEVVNNNFKDVNKKIAESKEDLNQALSSAESGLQKQIDDLKPVDVVVSELPLEEAKAYQIKESKKNLAMYLADHPITSSVHGGVAKQYSITSEKQQYLAQMIMMAQAAVQNTAEGETSTFQPSWNASGEECTYDWTLEELWTLSMEIEAVVRPLVSRQQSMESAITKAQTVDEVLAVSITF